MVKKPYVVSKNLKGSTELTLIARIKPGFVGLPDPMSHGTRLKRLLANLFELRKRGVETDRSGFVGPLERLRGIHFVRWCVFDEGQRLLLAVSFDRPWEPYIRRIVDEAGPLLDVIFMHCEGYEGHTSVDGYERFAKWVREAQAECDFYFAAAPGLTTDDVRYLKAVRSELELQGLTRHDSAATSARAQAVTDAVLTAPIVAPEPPPPGAYEVAELFRCAVGLYRLRSLFPAGAGGVHSDRETFDRATRSVLLGVVRASDGALPPLPPILDQQYSGIGHWYAALLKPPKPIEPPATALAAGATVQGGIVAEASSQLMTHGAVALLKLGANPSRLLEFLAQVTASTSATAIKYNAGLTPQGLKALGLTHAELSAFPMEFLQGMEERAGVLGDVGGNHPSNWRRPKLFVDLAATEETVPLGTVEAVVLLQTSHDSDPREDYDWSKQHPLFEAVSYLETLGARVLSIEPLRRDPKRVKNGRYREHFGFLDGFSQPSLAADAPAADAVSLGEVLLGYPNDRGEVSGNGDLFRNGTYLVVRKLGQDVKAFEQFTREHVGLAAKLMGREQEGASATEPKPAHENQFDYEQDSGGGCPLQAHVRLANPRTPDTRSVHGLKVRVPRILRRGFSYGPPYDEASAGAPRGLMFLAYNASIADQYEVIQRWLNGANATGLDSTQRDPITGAIDQEGGTVFRYSEAGVPRAHKLPAFVTLEWGMYLFVPSPAALMGLVERVQRPARDARCPAHVSGSAAADARGDYAAMVQAGTAILQKLLARGPEAAEPWLGVLEEQGARERAFATLSAIREAHGVLRTPIGVLVTSADAALTVLRDEKTYSVREYYRRMHDSDMVMYLGMDKAPLAATVCPLKAAPGMFKDQGYVDAIQAGQINYARESQPNGYLAKIRRAEAFVMALAVTRQAVLGSFKVALSTQHHIGQVLGQPLRPVTTGMRITSDLAVLAERVVSALSQSWFGLPDGERMRHGGQPSGADDPVAYCPADFTYFSQYVFRPVPDSTAATLAKRRGPVVTKSTRAFVLDQLAKPLAERVRFFKELAGNSAEPDVELLTRSLVGTVDGFVAANFGSFLSTVGQWLESEDFWRIQQELSATLARLKVEAEAVAAGASADALEAELADESALLARAVCALSKAPKPPWVHRTALRETNLAGVAIAPGELVVVHVGQCAVQGGADLLFGRSGRADGPLHGCPAKEMAMGVLAGMLTGVLSLRNVRTESPLLVSFELPAELADQAAAILASSSS